MKGYDHVPRSKSATRLGAAAEGPPLGILRFPRGVR